MKKSIKKISPIDIYRLLPRTDCKKCNEANCMAFATKLVNGELIIQDCSPLLTDDYEQAYMQLTTLLAPPVKQVMFGIGNHTAKIGGKYIQFRHELTYHNPTLIAIDVTDAVSNGELEKRIKRIERFSYNYIGKPLTLNAIAIRSTSQNPSTFASIVQKVSEMTEYPLILCSLNPAVIEAGLLHVKDKRPLIYAATKDNWKSMADLALKYQCPLVLFAPNDIPLLRSLARTMVEYGITDLALDPGTFADIGLCETINNFTMIRKAACKIGDELLGFPLVGMPITVWGSEEISKEVLQWKETIISSMLISRYADLLIMHSLEGWVLLPLLIWRFNIYTDPRKPVSVEPGVRTFGSPDKDSPVLLTTNYALTYFTVESDIKYANLNCYLIVVDTNGISVESAVAGRYLTAEKIAKELKESGIADSVNHRYLVLPGLAARLSGEVEEATGWNVIVGPKDSSGLPQFIKEKWPPK